MTRFGEISPLFKNVINLWQFLKVYSVFGKIVNLLGQILCAIGQKFIVVNGKILKE